MFSRKKRKTNDSDAKNWYKDKFESVRQQRDILLVVTLLSLFGAATSGFVVMWITPYKSVEPYVIQIDEKSGIVQRVDPVQRTEFTSSEAIDRYFVVQYVRAREEYVPSIFTQQYNLVRVMSTQPIFRRYAQQVSRSNEQSPLNVLEALGRRSVTFKNISFIGRNEQFPRATKVALVRIMTEDFNYKNSNRVQSHRLITVEFQYANLALNEEERFLNPIGFLVTDYQNAQEVVQ